MSDDAQSQDRRIAVILAAGVFALFAVVLVYTLAQKKPDYVMAFVTGDDCLRQFSDADCRSIVSRAQALHAHSAPRFTDSNACALVYGVGRCAALSENGVTLKILAPGLAAIAVTHDQSFVLPLYFGPISESGPAQRDDGRAVYFRNRPVGRLVETKFGGASLPALNGNDGQPLTSEALGRFGS